MNTKQGLEGHAWERQQKTSTWGWQRSSSAACWHITTIYFKLVLPTRSLDHAKYWIYQITLWKLWIITRERQNMVIVFRTLYILSYHNRLRQGLLDIFNLTRNHFVDATAHLFHIIDASYKPSAKHTSRKIPQNPPNPKVNKVFSTYWCGTQDGIHTLVNLLITHNTLKREFEIDGATACESECFSESIYLTSSSIRTSDISISRPPIQINFFTRFTYHEKQTFA